MKRLPLLAAAALLAVGVPAPALAASAQAPGCETIAARLDWGFKESFRAYIDGSIANGSWEVGDGAAYETPLFLFPGAGRLDPRAPNGQVGFIGSVRFTGHGGILDTTIANPTLLFRGEEPALLLLDVSGPTMDGDEVAVTAAPFVEVDLRGQDLEPFQGIITIDDAPTTLTADGAAAFPNYPAGEAFDPISATIDVGDCDLGDQPIGTDVVDTGPSGPDLPAVLTVSGILLVIATVIAAIRLRRRPDDAGPKGPVEL